MPRPNPSLCPECAVRLAEQEKQEAQRQVSAKREQRIRAALRSSTLGFFEKAAFDTWEERAEFPKQLAAVKRYVKDWDKHREDGTGLILTGTVGTGKTYLAMCAKNEIAKQAITVAVNVPELATKVSASWDRNTETKEHELMRVLVDADLLVLDDLGTESPKQWMLEALYRIVDGRYRRMAPMIVTANIEPKDFSVKFGERIADRLGERCSVLVMNGVSYRKILAKRRAEQ